MDLHLASTTTKVRVPIKTNLWFIFKEDLFALDSPLLKLYKAATNGLLLVSDRPLMPLPPAASKAKEFFLHSRNKTLSFSTGPKSTWYTAMEVSTQALEMTRFPTKIEIFTSEDTTTPCNFLDILTQNTIFTMDRKLSLMGCQLEV